MDFATISACRASDLHSGAHSLFVFLTTRWDIGPLMRWRQVKGTHVLLFLQCLATPREGASAGLSSLGTYKIRSQTFPATASAASLRSSRQRVGDEERPFAKAPQTARASISMTVLRECRRGQRSTHLSARMPACASNAPAWALYLAREHTTVRKAALERGGLYSTPCLSRSGSSSTYPADLSKRTNIPGRVALLPNSLTTSTGALATETPNPKDGEASLATICDCQLLVRSATSQGSMAK